MINWWPRWTHVSHNETSNLVLLSTMFSECFISDCYNMLSICSQVAHFYWDKNGNEYTINGETTITYMGNYTTTKYENMKVVYDGVNLTDLSGKKTISSKIAEDTYDAIITYESSEGFMVATEKAKNLSKESCTSVQRFVAENFQVFDSIRSEVPPSAISDGGKEKVDGTECEVKIINGTGSSGTTYDNVKAYVYNGFMVKTTGTINGMDGSSTITYYYA